MKDTLIFYLTKLKKTIYKNEQRGSFTMILFGACSMFKYFFFYDALIKVAPCKNKKTLMKNH